MAKWISLENIWININQFPIFIMKIDKPILMISIKDLNRDYKWILTLDLNGD